MKHSSFLVAVSGFLFFAALAITIRPSLASRGAAQVEAKEKVDAPITAAAASASVFNYQGQLTDASGNPITNAALPMTFSLFSVSIGGTACWTENQTVNVQSGQFNVLLGQTTAIPAACFSSESYLELAINSETLSPRELLTGVASSVQATTLVANAETQGSVTIPESAIVGGIESLPSKNSLEITHNGANALRLISGNNVYMFMDADDSSTGTAQFNIYRDSRNIGGNVSQILSLNENGSLDLNGTITADALTSNGSITSAGNIRANGGNVFVGDVRALHLQGELKTLHLLPFADSDQFDLVCIGCGSVGRGLWVRGGAIVEHGLTVYGNCTNHTSSTGSDTNEKADCEPGTITSGAYVEANLMTGEERLSEIINRFEQGDLLCWSADDSQLEKCDMANDPLVMGVADSNGKPIVLGAEQTKVLGPVKAGDYLVASDVPGFAIASHDPSFGIVIGQALEDFDEESGLIMAMIRKM